MHVFCVIVVTDHKFKKKMSRDCYFFFYVAKHIYKYLLVTQTCIYQFINTNSILVSEKIIDYILSIKIYMKDTLNTEHYKYLLLIFTKHHPWI